MGDSLRARQAAIDVTLIAAVDRGGVIGADGGMPWHLPADLAWFKRQTRGKPIAMGRRTFEAIGRALPKRRNLVISRRPDFVAPGCEVLADVGAAIERARDADADELMVIGGAHIYALALPRATRLLLTQVNACYAGDTFFPAIDWSQWTQVEAQDQPADGDAPACRFLTYRRRSD